MAASSPRLSAGGRRGEREKEISPLTLSSEGRRLGNLRVIGRRSQIGFIVSFALAGCVMEEPMTLEEGFALFEQTRPRSPVGDYLVEGDLPIASNEALHDYYVSHFGHLCAEAPAY